jgi:uncharacterized protein YjbJ (UPF0337 family)
VAIQTQGQSKAQGGGDIEQVGNELLKPTRRRSVYVQQQPALNENISNQVRDEVGKATVGLQELNGQASEATAELHQRIGPVKGAPRRHARKSRTHSS